MMRLVCFLVFLAFGHVALAQCPEPGSNMCTFEYDPVTCSNGCSYDSLCLAEASGSEGCTKSCPAPDSTQACPAIFEPVLCGGFVWCIYDNLCTALAAGKQEIDCQRSCPEVPAATACTLDYNPFFCGGCLYSNECEKNAAWVDGAGLPDSSCVALPPITVPEGCPAVPDNVACDLSYAPVKCDNDCEYPNACLAENAGATGCSGTCPEPQGNVACTLEFEPVVCSDGCTYANECVAGAASQSGCTASCPAPSSAVACTREYEPVYCNGCVYDNECVAESAGFVASVSCSSIATTTQSTVTNTTSAAFAVKHAIPMVATAVFAAQLVA